MTTGHISKWFLAFVLALFILSVGYYGVLFGMFFAFCVIVLYIVCLLLASIPIVGLVSPVIFFFAIDYIINGLGLYFVWFVYAVVVLFSFFSLRLSINKTKAIKIFRETEK